MLPRSDADVTVWIFQVDKRFQPTGAWDSKEHLSQAVDILAENIKAMRRKFPTWSVDQHLKGRHACGGLLRADVLGALLAGPAGQRWAEEQKQHGSPLPTSSTFLQGAGLL